MSFKQIVNARRDASSNIVMNEAIVDAATKAKRSLMLQSFVDRVGPIVQPLLESYVAEAKDLGFSAETHFMNEDAYISQWSLSFVPKQGEVAERGNVAGIQNEADAIFRLYHDGRCNLRWHAPGGGTQASIDFSKANPSQDMSVDDIDNTRIEKWLDAFTSAMFSYRESRDRGQR